MPSKPEFSINIKVGDACNLKCLYCIQTSEKERKDPMPTELNPDLIKFINGLVSNKVKIHFSGGEPLLYFDIIKDIVAKIKHKNVSFSIETNGSLLTDEIVTWLNLYKFTIVLSYDGLNSDITKGFNVFASDTLRYRFSALNDVILHGLITAYSYPYDLINELERKKQEYESLNPTGKIHLSVAEITDFCIQNRDILDLDYDKIKSDIQLLKKEKLGIWFLDSYNTKADQSQMWDSLKITNNIFCDLQGNLFPVITSRIILGNISTTSLLEYSLVANKYIKQVVMHNTDCANCSINTTCNNRARLSYINYIGGSNETTCRLKKAIQDALRCTL